MPAAVKAADAKDARITELEAQLAERTEETAFLAERVAEQVAAQAAAGAAPPASSSDQPAPAPAAPPPDPAAAARAREDQQLHAMAIIAREGQVPASRGFWLGELHRLGRHLAPELPPAAQLRAALADPRGQAFHRARTEAAA